MLLPPLTLELELVFLLQSHAPLEGASALVLHLLLGSLAALAAGLMSMLLARLLDDAAVQGLLLLLLA